MKYIHDNLVYFLKLILKILGIILSMVHLIYHFIISMVILLTLLELLVKQTGILGIIIMMLHSGQGVVALGLEVIKWLLRFNLMEVPGIVVD